MWSLEGRMKKILHLFLWAYLIVGCKASIRDNHSHLEPFPTITSGPSMTIKPTQHPQIVSGRVVNENGQPISDAIVRLQATKTQTSTDEQGVFRLEDIPLNKPVTITAWAEGYYINGAQASSEQSEIVIELHNIPQDDNPHYEWLTSGTLRGEMENQGCAECHAAQDSNPPFPLPLDEWRQDAHSQSAVNPRFLSTYNGTDLHGNQSPQTTFIPASPTRRNSGGYDYVALPPDPDQPYFGPGYKLDFPDSAGNCATCHVPGAASKPGMSFSVEVNEIEGVEKEGVFCDFCHKIWDVKLDSKTEMPDPDKPGVMSYVFRRPPEGHQLFIGPYDDVAPGEDTFSPLQSESAYCAPCHTGTFWSNKIYNSYGEWLDSPYSDPENGMTCQDCHMPPSGATMVAREEVGANQRAPDTVFTHKMPGALDEEFLQNAVTLNIDARNDDKVEVNVQIVNDNTGHHVPTDYPGRQLILIVQAFDGDGNLLEQISGPVLPDWCGEGDPDEGYYAGLPGVAYAKILQEDWTGYYPTVAYWNPTTVLMDNRIAAFETAESEYVFEAGAEVEIQVQLWLRRSFIDLMDWKDWEVPDILMEESSLVLK